MTSCLHCGHADPAGFAFCPRCGAKAVDSVGEQDPLLGRILNGKYRVESQIGEGAMGTVYLGEHIGLKKKIALKVLHSDLQVSDESLQRFQREGIAVGKFNHPHAIQIFDFDRSEGRVFYLAMEFVEGFNLTQFLRQHGRLAIGVAVRLARQMLSCLAEAHRHGIVHRDLKPDNIMVTEGSRGELRVKVLDFGLSKLVDRRPGSSLVTQPGRLLGTPLYMAPEQVAGEEADERSDVYAAGLILYEMLAGERPFREQNATQLFLTRATAEAPSLVADHPELGVPGELDAVLQRALQREREQRFQSAEEMLAALDEVPVELAPGSMNRSLGASTSRRPAPVAAPRPMLGTATAPPAGPAARRPRRMLLFGLGLTLLAGAAVLGFTLLGRGGGARPARVRQIPEGERSELERRYIGYVDEACIALQAGDPSSAITAVEKAKLLGLRDAEALLVGAEAFRAKGDVDTALATFRAAAEVDPSFLEPVVGLGWVLLERGDLAGAQAAFVRAGELAPDDAQVLAGRGALAWKGGASAAAAELLRQAATRDPACANAHLYLGRLLLDQGDGAGAVAALIEAKRNDSRSVRALLWLGEAYLAEERLDEADVQFQDALRLDPDAVDVRVERAALLIERQRPDAALQFLEESIQRRADPRLWVLRGVALADSGADAEAISALRRGVELGSRDPEARCLLAVLLHARGELAEARAQYELVLQEAGDVPLANLDLGLVLFAQQEYAAAAQRLQRVLDFDEESAPAHFHLGLLYMDYLGDPVKAAEHLARYQQLGGADPRVAGWLGRLR